MPRLILAVLLTLVPALCRADVTCAEMQAALHVPAPAGASEDPDGPLGCTQAALQLFQFNQIAAEVAVPVTDPARLHGAWLGDDMLSFLLGVTVPGQELLLIEAGGTPETVKVTQYWIKAAAPEPARPLWSEQGEYLGVVAELTLEARGGGKFSPPYAGETVLYGARQLEFERSYDLHVKSKINHFELPVLLSLHEGVLVLRGQQRNPVTRDLFDTRTSYTRVDADAAELALGIVTVFELSQGRNFDCLAHQLTEGTGPLFEVIAPDGRAELDSFVRQLIGMGVARTGMANALTATTDADERARLRSEMMAWIEDYTALTRDGPQAGLLRRVADGADRLCPDYF